MTAWVRTLSSPTEPLLGLHSYAKSRLEEDALVTAGVNATYRST
jgi:hypothetical protein